MVYITYIFYPIYTYIITIKLCNVGGIELRCNWKIVRYPRAYKLVIFRGMEVTLV